MVICTYTWLWRDERHDPCPPAEEGKGVRIMGDGRAIDRTPSRVFFLAKNE